MNNRLIGGTIYTFLFYGSLVQGHFFRFFIGIAFVIGFYELYRIFMVTTNKAYTFGYGLLFLLGMVSLLITANNTGPIVYICAVIMFTDVCAYFVGMNFGKTHFSKWSPNKTIEGFIGGLIGGVILAIISMEILKMVPLIVNNEHLNEIVQHYNPFTNIISLVIFSLIISGLGQLGDLMQSKLKRLADVKDSGTIVFGHGGILDRFDSLVLPATIITIILIWSQR